MWAYLAHMELKNDGSDSAHYLTKMEKDEYLT